MQELACLVHSIGKIGLSNREVLKCSHNRSVESSIGKGLAVGGEGVGCGKRRGSRFGIGKTRAG